MLICKLGILLQTGFTVPIKMLQFADYVLLVNCALDAFLSNLSVCFVMTRPITDQILAHKRGQNPLLANVKIQRCERKATNHRIIQFQTSQVLSSWQGLGLCSCWDHRVVRNPWAKTTLCKQNYLTYQPLLKLNGHAQQANLSSTSTVQLHILQFFSFNDLQMLNFLIAQAGNSSQ